MLAGYGSGLAQGLTQLVWQVALATCSTTCFIGLRIIPQAFSLASAKRRGYTLNPFSTQAMTTTSTIHLLLPRSEAKQIREGHATRLLFPIGLDLDTTNGFFRVSEHTDSQFPARSHVDELAAQHEKAAWSAGVESEHGYVVVANAGRLWNFLGDGTHSTQLLRTPHGLVIGQELSIENRYNVPATRVKVTAIEMLRLQTGKDWFWLVELSAIG